jgi:hypothetical protein
VSDKGTEFVNRMMRAIHLLLHQTHISTTPYHLSANGKVEQQNRIIESLQKDLSNTVSKKELDEFTLSINNYFSQVNSRIDLLQATSTVQISNKR